jgi:hypothetical protein
LPVPVVWPRTGATDVGYGSRRCVVGVPGPGAVVDVVLVDVVLVDVVVCAG